MTRGGARRRAMEFARRRRAKTRRGLHARCAGGDRRLLVSVPVRVLGYRRPRPGTAAPGLPLRCRCSVCVAGRVRARSCRPCTSASRCASIAASKPGATRRSAAKGGCRGLRRHALGARIGFGLALGLQLLLGWLPESVTDRTRHRLFGRLAVAGAAAGLYYMTRCYRIKARPFWDHWQVFTTFFGHDA